MYGPASSASYENAKDAAGLAEDQGRLWPGFHSHLSMVWLAMTWMARLRRPLPPPDGSRPQATDAPRVPAQTPIPAEVAVEEPGPLTPPIDPMIELAFADRTVRVRCAAPGLVDVLSLPRQAWESLQSVHRRFLQWCRIAVFHERLLLRRWPTLPILSPALTAP